MLPSLVDYLGAEEGAATLSKIGDFYPSDMTRQPGVSVLGQLGDAFETSPSPAEAISAIPPRDNTPNNET